MHEFAKWPTSFQRLCSKQRKNIVFLTEINNKTYLKLLVFCDQWKTENDIPTLEWPPQSPDLNTCIIENVWKVIKTNVQ
jgi:hypothetical protein